MCADSGLSVSVVIIVDCLGLRTIDWTCLGILKTFYLNSKRLPLFEINWWESQCCVPCAGLLDAVGGHSQDSSVSTGNWCLKPPPLLSDGFSRSTKINYFTPLSNHLFFCGQNLNIAVFRGVSLWIYSLNNTQSLNFSLR